MRTARRMPAALSSVAVAASLLTGAAVVGAPAQAADAAPTCSPSTVFLFQFGEGSAMPNPSQPHPSTWIMKDTVTGTGTSSASMSNDGRAVDLDDLGPWKAFQKVIGGKAPYLYAFDFKNSTESKRGIYVSKRNSTTGRLSTPVKIDNGTHFLSWGTSSLNRITADDEGTIYTITKDGILRRYVIPDVTASPAVTRYTHVGAAAEWKNYDLIVGAGKGVIYARKGSSLFRYRLDPGSERWVERAVLVGSSGWDRMDQIASAGADTLFAVRDDGAVLHYRYDASGKKFAPLGGTTAGKRLNPTTSWTDSIFGQSWVGSELAVIPSQCKPATPYSKAPTPSLSPSSYAPVSVLRTPGTAGKKTRVDFLFTNNNGAVYNVGMPDEIARDQLDTPVLKSSAGDVIVGSPTYVLDPEYGASLYGLRSDGHVLRGLTNPVRNLGWNDELGLFTGPISGVQVSTRATAVFGVADGHVWVAENSWMPDSAGVNQPVGAVSAWRPLGTGGLPDGVTIEGQVSSIALSSGGRAVLVATGSDGRLYRGTYAVPTETTISFSGWTALPAAPESATFAGAKASLWVAPGNLLRIAARTDDGAVVTLGQTTTGFPSTWTTLAAGPEVSTGDREVTLTGNPAVVLNPSASDGRVSVFSRTTDGSVLAIQQLDQGCENFSSWWPVSDSTLNNSKLMADPVTYVIERDGQPEWGFASYDASWRINAFFTVSTETPAPTGSCQSASGPSSAGSQLSGTASDGSVRNFSSRKAPAGTEITPPTFTKLVAPAPPK